MPKKDKEKTKRKFDAAWVKSLSSKGKRIEYFDTNTKGLMLRLYKSGSKTYFYKYRIYDTMKMFKVGSTRTTSLADARKKVRRLKVKIQDGIDPQAERQQERNRTQPKTFEELAELYKTKHLPKLKQSTRHTYRSRIDAEMIPAFKGMYIENITRGVITELLEEIATERNQPTHSNRVRAILSSMFSFWVQRELAEYNPVKIIKPLGNEVKRERVLEEPEIRAFWEAIADITEPMQFAFKILLLLGQRKGETCRMQWDHIEYDTPHKRTITDPAGNTTSEAYLVDLWTIPARMTKANREHKLPLPPLAVDIIRSLKNDSPYVFESNRHKGQPVKWLHHSFKKATKQAGIPNIRIHDLRRTAATYMADLGTDRTVLGKVLNHKARAGDNHVTARYDRHGYIFEKQTALNRWSNRLQDILAESD